MKIKKSIYAGVLLAWMAAMGILNGWDLLSILCFGAVLICECVLIYLDYFRKG